MNKSNIKLKIVLDELFQYHIVWVCLSLSLFLLVWSLNSSWYIPISLSEEKCVVINTIISSLMLSFIAGVMVFGLTICIPNIKNKYNIYPSIASLIYDTRNLISDLSLVTLSGVKCSSKFIPSKFLNRILVTTDGLNLDIDNISDTYDDILVRYDCAYLYKLSLMINNILINIDEVLRYTQYLKPEEIKCLMDINHCYFFIDILQRTGYAPKTDNYTDMNLDIRLILLKKHLQGYRELIENISHINRFDQYLIEN